MPDVPFEEKHEIEDVANKYGIDIISLIATTSEDRIKKIAKEAKGFIYVDHRWELQVQEVKLILI